MKTVTTWIALLDIFKTYLLKNTLGNHINIVSHHYYLYYVILRLVANINIKYI